MSERINDLPGLKKGMLVTLTAAQTKRKEIPNWVEYERKQMLCAINKRRAFLGKPDVTVQQLRRAEDNAFGHSDYSEKFALYCAMLVLAP
jgi:hypothetical protein